MASKSSHSFLAPQSRQSRKEYLENSTMLVPSEIPPMVTRRQMICQLGNGFGALGLASVLASAGLAAEKENPGTEPAAGGGLLSPKKSHFPARAKRVIFLFMNGGPSQVDTFDPKPSLDKYAGQRPKGA